MVTSLTENEASRYGRFLNQMLTMVKNWHGSKSCYEKVDFLFQYYLKLFTLTLSATLVKNWHGSKQCYEKVDLLFFIIYNCLPQVCFQKLTVARKKFVLWEGWYNCCFYLNISFNKNYGSTKLTWIFTVLNWRIYYVHTRLFNFFSYINYHCFVKTI